MSSEQYHRPDAKSMESLKDMATKLRIHSIEATCASNSGHPTSCASAAEIMSVLFFHTMKFSVEDPRDASSDRFVLSKGHAAPLLYAAWAEAGLFPTSELLTLRKLTSDLEGHPTPRLSFIDVATGSLGQGLSCAVGMAYTGKYLENAGYRVYCMVGDGETAEGAVWEAMAFASLYKLDNVVAIFDVNRLGQSEATSLGHNLDIYKERAESFGWNTYVVDGHDVEALCRVLHDAAQVKNKPTCIVAKTFKGRDIAGIEDQDNWHGKPLGDKAENALKVLKENLGNKGPLGLKPKRPDTKAPTVNVNNIKLSSPPDYKMGDKIAPRLAYGKALVKIGESCQQVISLDGDVKNSTFAIEFKKKFPERFIECFIAEQNLVGVAVGCETRRRTVPFVSSFAAFFSRAYDQIRMAAVSQSNINFCGSHVGVSIGEDGPSQMALEDLAMFRSIPDCTVFYPSDAVSMERAVELAANTKGMCFIRSSRPNVPVLYSATESFKIGQAKVVRKSDQDSVTVVAACITLVEAMSAADELAKSGIGVRIIDPFTIKPIDADTIIKNAKQTGGRIVTVEDHYLEGGLGEAVCAAVSECRDITVKKIAVREIPRSGKPVELLDRYGISCPHIVKAINQILSA